MKKYLLFFVLMSFISVFEGYSQVRVTSDGHLQVDYSSGDHYLTFGDNAGGSYPEWGKWAIEDFNGGLNFFKAWPYSDYGNYKLFLKDNGYIGINDGTPSYRLDVNGDIATYGTLRISSDTRFKKDIKPISSSLTNLKKLNGVSYKMKKEKIITYDLSSIKDKDKRKAAELEMQSQGDIEETDKYGFVAQELQKVYPELVDEDEEGYLNVDYIGLIPILVESIKELESKIEYMEQNCCNDNSNLKNASIYGEDDFGLGSGTAVLYQNAPNPFSNQTIISFEIPQTVSSAQLHICNMVGNLLKTISINQRGRGSVQINGNEFNAGMYLYSLVNDGKIIDTKQMLLTKQ